MQSLIKQYSSAGRFAPALRVIGVVILIGAVALNDARGEETERAKRVLMVSTGSRLASGFGTVEQKVIDTLQQMKPGRIEFYSEYLDIIRFPSASYQRLFHDYLQEKYADQPPDLVILNYVGNLVVAEKFLAQLFPGVRMLLAGLTEEEVPVDQFRGRVSGIAQRTDLRGTMEMILRLQPDTQRIVVIAGVAEVDRLTLERAKQAARPFMERVNFDFWGERSMSEIRQAVKALPPNSAILLTRFYRDTAGEAFIPPQAAQLIAETANAPLYVLGAASVGGGAVGGSVTDAVFLGERAGKLASQILQAPPTASIPFEVRTGGTPVFDWRALKRWGISESRLPPGSAVKFRQLSSWEQYRWYIAGALAIIAAEAALICALILQRTRRRRAERELDRNREELAHAARISAMGQLASALAHELSQPLGAIMRNAEAGELFLQANPPDLRELTDILADIRKDDRRAGDVIDRMRALLKRRQFQWSELDLNGLAEEVASLVRPDAEARKVKLSLDLAPCAIPVRGDRVQLQQVLLNLLLNSMDAMDGSARQDRRMSVHTRHEDGHAELCVRDTGPGIAAEYRKRVFDPFFTTKANGMGMGLAISQTIIQAHGGSITADDNPEGGATFRITLCSGEDARPN